MAVYVVTWNLNREADGYSAARDAFIKRLNYFDNIKDPGLESVVFIAASNTADEVSEFLRQPLDEDDRLFVSKLNRGERQGWLDKDVWEWINAHS